MRVHAVEVRLVKGEGCVLRAHADLSQVPFIRYQVCNSLSLHLVASKMGRMAESKASSC